MIGSYRGLKTISHGGVDSGYRAEMLWFPEVDFGVVILANLSKIKPGSLARKVADIYLGERLSTVELFDAPAIDMPEEDLAALAGLYRDQRRLVTRTLVMADGNLTVNGMFDEHPKLEPFADGRFRLGTQPSEVEIKANSAGELEYHEIFPDGKRNTYIRVPLATPTPEVLASYAGTFYCADLRLSYSVFVRDGKLIARPPRDKDRELEPTIEDGFNIATWDVVFSRDGRGDVDGFDMFGERHRYLRFDRM
jgi:hypothetical protein